MKFIDYLKDKMFDIIILINALVIVYIILFSFNINKYIMVFILTVLIISFIFIYALDFFRRYIFYRNFEKNLNSIDKKYLITELINASNFLDGKLILSYLYTINKSMTEDVNFYKRLNVDFIDFIELWVHEVKTPIATGKMIYLNNKTEATKSMNEELDKIDYFVEQVLYYTKIDNVEKDYIIKNTNIKKVCENIIKRNKKDLMSKHIKIELNSFYEVKTDEKWISFIINQIFTNSIKYSKDNPIIKINMTQSKNSTHLIIEDNGMGVEETEISKVFDKGFTGSNGRILYKSTGIGLYLSKKLAEKLGHQIIFESTVNKGTKVSIKFPINSMTKM